MMKISSQHNIKSNVYLRDNNNIINRVGNRVRHIVDNRIQNKIDNTLKKIKSTDVWK
jgi:hypothetical protein